MLTALQAAIGMLDELEHEHKKLSQMAEKARQLRAQNAQMAQEVSRLPELKKAADELQQQVVQLQHVKKQIQRLQVGFSGLGASCLLIAVCAVAVLQQGWRMLPIVAGMQVHLLQTVLLL